jgi:uncharacterized membrane protein YbhN (UPF0104 family)
VNKKKGTLLLLKGIFAFGICGYLFSILDISELKEALARTNFNYLAVGMLIILAKRILYAWQTVIALNHHGISLTTARALMINIISGFYNLFLPGGLTSGVVKWYKFSKPSGKHVEVLAAIFFLRFICTISILFLGFVGFILDNPFGSALLLWVSIFFVGGLITFYMCFFSRKAIIFVEAIFSSIQSWIPPFFEDKLREIIISLETYRHLSFKETYKMLILPIINQLLAVLFLIAIAFSIEIRIPVFALFWLWSMVYVLELIPASISGLGFRESALVYLLPLYGVEPARAMLFSLIIFSFTILFGLIGGILEAKELFG